MAFMLTDMTTSRIKNSMATNRSTRNSSTMQTRTKLNSPDDLLKTHKGKKDPHLQLFESVIFGKENILASKRVNSWRRIEGIQTTPSTKLTLPTDIDQLLLQHYRDNGRSDYYGLDKLNQKPSTVINEILNPYQKLVMKNNLKFGIKTKLKPLNFQSKEASEANCKSTEVHKAETDASTCPIAHPQLGEVIEDNPDSMTSPQKILDKLASPGYTKGVQLNPPVEKDTEKLGNWLCVMLLKVFSEDQSQSSMDRFSKVEAVFSSAFKELCSQIRIQSNSRSNLLNKLWDGYFTELQKFYQSIIDQKDKEIEKLNIEITKLNKFMTQEVKDLKESFISASNTQSIRRQLEELSCELKECKIKHSNHLTAIKARLFESSEKIIFRNQYIDSYALSKLKESMQIIRDLVFRNVPL